jgi:O-acetylhomoserine (thiol)-lyase
VGDTRSLVAHPASMTHCRLSPEQRAGAGITGSTIRLSVGLEAAADLVADLDQALAPLAGVAETTGGLLAAVAHAGTGA